MEIRENGNGRVEKVDMEVDVAIAGGGLAGLSLAVGLHHRGIDAYVFEKAPHLRMDSATGVSLAANAMRALEGVKPGLSKQIEEIFMSTALYIVVRDEDGTETRQLLPGEYTMAGWRFCQQVLANNVDNSKVFCNHRFLSYKTVQGGVEAQFLVKGENGEESDCIKVLRAKLLVGADGLWSRVRHIMVGDRPRYLNYLNWNALVYTPNGKVFKYNKGEVNMIHSRDERVLAYMSDIGRGYCLWLLRCLDTDGKLEKDFEERFSAGLDKSVSKQRALDILKEMNGWDDLRAAIEATDHNLIYERRSMDRLPLDKWTDEGGHVLLIGDAAHGMYSAAGMGARTAFEDSHQLTVELEKAFKTSNIEKGIQDALHRFEFQRIPRVRKIQRFASDMTEQECFQSEEARRLVPEQKAERFNEFTRWTCQYPFNMQGDFNSTWCKP
ncbi:zeaxanthin epoxidase, chloroplastic isoform X1 [Cryptomeria japonica]|uniref:zeaxanthin epoxidase, chloroplastic isoform X1 n=2 Tax=Cryptomeria japonica TaxID=3369 RepID=UPI0027DA11B7|nr:zeaxanthin epoxidase, chloroplastic isoform X1 [Cryptomeria japonica]